MSTGKLPSLPVQKIHVIENLQCLGLLVLIDKGTKSGSWMKILVDAELFPCGNSCVNSHRLHIYIYIYSTQAP